MQTNREEMASGKMKAVVSILIPAYRSGEMLLQAVRSALEQDYPALEVVVCDDGSEDFDAEEIRNLLSGQDNPKLEILHQVENMGTVRNLNCGLEHSTGEWIMILAADDAMAGRNVIAQLMERADSAKNSWLIGCTALCNRYLEPVGEYCPNERHLRSLTSAEEFYSALCAECFLPSSGNVYRRDFLLKLGSFDGHYFLVEDWPLFLKAARSGCLPEVCSIPAVLHRESGVSGRSAGRNVVYQRDLIETMKREIIPYLDRLPAARRKKIEKLCVDKEAVYRFRFQTHGLWRKFGWVCTHMGTVLRRLVRRSEV